MIGAATYRRYAPQLIVALAAGLLAVEPLRWLAQTWRDPAYDSNGFLVFALCIALFVWSVTSPVRNAGRTDSSLAIVLLASSALVRLAGQILAINTIGALTLVVDVFAIGLMLGLHRRMRAVSPMWLAVAFAFSLPLERIVQRTIGYGLQHLSADGACLVLQSGFERVMCNGVRIMLDGTDVLVDLPCSGAQATLLLLLVFVLVAAVVRPSLKQAIVGGAVALVSAFVSNVARIVLLAIGIAHPDWFGGQNVMEQPWHDLIGLATLAMACMPLIVWMRWTTKANVDIDVPTRIERDGWWLQPKATPWSSRHTVPASLTVLAVALVIVNLPRTPVDVARQETPMTLPAHLAGYLARPVGLSRQETQFFTQFGGTAAKARYGNHSLLLVRTSSPLRHLHAPEDCLRGLGFRVTYLGAEFSSVPTAVYRAVSPTGESFRIDVTFMSERGLTTTNVATAVWHWLQGTDRIWTAVQRITPETEGPDAHRSFGQSVVAALELPTTKNVFKANGVR